MITFVCQTNYVNYFIQISLTNGSKTTALHEKAMFFIQFDLITDNKHYYVFTNIHIQINEFLGTLK